MQRRSMITGTLGSIVAAAVGGGPARFPSHPATAEATTPPSHPAGVHPVQESVLPVDGITPHVVRQGRGAPMLFVHGFPDTARTWQRQMAAIAVDVHLEHATVVGHDWGAYAGSRAAVESLRPGALDPAPHPGHTARLDRPRLSGPHHRRIHPHRLHGASTTTGRCSSRST